MTKPQPPQEEPIETIATRERKNERASERVERKREKYRVRREGKGRENEKSKKGQGREKPASFPPR